MFVTSTGQTTFGLTKTLKRKPMTSEIQKNRSRKAIYTGLVIMGIGVIWLLRKMGLYLPHWIWGWEMILILIGVGIGVGNRFRNPASWILIAIGGVALLNDIFNIPFHLWEYFWPLVVIAIGLIIILKPRRHRARVMSQYRHGGDGSDTETVDEEGEPVKGTYSADDKLDMVSVFSGNKKTIFSKKFLGGETVTVFGGSEINLLNADFDKAINIEATVVFGGLKLIVPQGWEVRSEANAILAGVEDKRYSAVQVIPQDKVLVLTGTVVFGGIDIVSF